MVTFDPLYLDNGNSYVKFVRILLKDILIKNLKKKTRQNRTKNNCSTSRSKKRSVSACLGYIHSIFKSTLCFLARMVVLKFHESGPTRTSYYMETLKKYHFWPPWAYSLQTSKGRASIFNPRFYIVEMIIVLKFYKNWFTGTKVIARKPCVYRRMTTTTTDS